MSGKKEQKSVRPKHSESKERMYNDNAGSETARLTQSTSPAETLRVILPDEPPRLNPGAATALLRILLKAHARLNGDDNSEGATNE